MAGNAEVNPHKHEDRCLRCGNDIWWKWDSPIPMIFNWMCMRCNPPPEKYLETKALEVKSA